MIYFDHNATTPLDPRVLDAMMPYFTTHHGNAASRHHAAGCDAAMAVERARAAVAAVLSADPREIVFTSGATEALNLALKGVADTDMYTARGRHLVTVRTEHRAVLDTCAWLAERGWEVTMLPVDGAGRIDLGQLAAALTERTAMVAIMHANNETGVVHPIAEIGRLCRERGVLYVCDATQSFGREALDVHAASVDLLSVSAHKLHGPKGVGALYVRRRGPRVRCAAQMHGGGHERGLRSGTLNVPAIVGFGRAVEICRTQREQEQSRLRALRDRLESALCERLPGTVVNGGGAPRLANTLNASFPGVDGEALMRALPGIAVSSSSACTTAALQPSYVLGAMGRDDAAIAGSVRFSLGRFNTAEEVDTVVDRVAAAALRQAMPVDGGHT